MKVGFVYWIHLPSDTDVLTQGYVGVTSKTPKARLSSHKMNYRKFVRDGSYGGCKKLYSTVKSSPNEWDDYILTPLIKADLDYCYDLEQKLRPSVNIGLNTKIGGEKSSLLGWKASEETKAKLALIRKKWVMSVAAREKLSRERTGSGNPMAGTPPWEQSQVIAIGTDPWRYEGDVYNYVINAGKPIGVRVASREFPHVNFNSIDSMIRKFRKGWNPFEDVRWLEYVRSFDGRAEEKKTEEH